jgi:hypothetical protein
MALLVEDVDSGGVHMGQWSIEFYPSRFCYGLNLLFKKDKEY